MSAQEAGGFSDLEALKMAEGMEKEGLAFYSAAEAAVDVEELKSTFRTLAGEERDHLKTFDLPRQRKRLVLDTAGIVRLGEIIAQNYLEQK